MSSNHRATHQSNNVPVRQDIIGRRNHGLLPRSINITTTSPNPAKSPMDRPIWALSCGINHRNMQEMVIADEHIIQLGL